MFEFLKQHYKITLGVLAVLLLVASFVAGRFSRPAEVKIQEKIVTKEVVKTVTVVQKVTDTQKQTNQQKHVHKVIEKTKLPDGTETTKVVVDSGSTTDTQQNTQQTTNQSTTVDKTTTQSVDYSKTETNQANFQLSLKLGVDVSNLKAQGTAPFVQPLILGLEVDKRFFGPLWLGVWGTTNNKFNDFQLGLAVTYQH